MRIEAAALADAAVRLDRSLIRAVELILAHPGKIIVTGIGKSGHIARKIVATLCSTGTPPSSCTPPKRSTAISASTRPATLPFCSRKTEPPPNCSRSSPRSAASARRSSEFLAAPRPPRHANGRAAGRLCGTRSRPPQSRPHCQRRHRARARPCPRHRAHVRSQLHSGGVRPLPPRRTTRPLFDPNRCRSHAHRRRRGLCRARCHRCGT